MSSIEDALQKDREQIIKSYQHLLENTGSDAPFALGGLRGMAAGTQSRPATPILQHAPLLERVLALEVGLENLRAEFMQAANEIYTRLQKIEITLGI